MYSVSSLWIFKLVVPRVTTRLEWFQFSPVPCYFHLWAHNIFFQHVSDKIQQFRWFKTGFVAICGFLYLYQRFGRISLFRFGHENKPKCNKMLIWQQNPRHKLRLKPPTFFGSFRWVEGTRNSLWCIDELCILIRRERSYYKCLTDGGVC